MNTIDTFMADYAALKERVRLLEAENAALCAKSGWEQRGVRSTVTVFGRTIPELARSLERLERFDAAAKLD